MKINLLDLDVLKEIANIGVGNAMTSLANLLNQKVKLSLPKSTMPKVKDLAYALNPPDGIVVGVLVKISGDINGMMMFVMQEDSACKLLDIFLDKKRTSLSDFDEMDISVITEIGNILNSSYLTALSKFLKLRIKQSIPYVSIDMAAAVLSVPAIEFGKVGDTALLIESEFIEREETLSGYFILVPDAAEQEIEFKY